MGLHGKYWRVVTQLKNWAVICLLLAGPMDALAQVSDRQISDELRQRRAETKYGRANAPEARGHFFRLEEMRRRRAKNFE